MQWEIGSAGKAYSNWTAAMALGLSTGVPWVMCKQEDAPYPIVCFSLPSFSYLIFHFSLDIYEYRMLYFGLVNLGLKIPLR